MSENTTSRRRPAAARSTETVTSAEVGTVESTGILSAGAAVIMVDFDIEFPEPKARAGGVGKPSIYPFKSLEVGKSFLAPLAQLKTLQRAAITAQRGFDVTTGETKTRMVKGEEKVVPVRQHTRTFRVAQLSDAQYAKLAAPLKAQLPEGAVVVWRTA